jgi:chromosome segregation ATPase
MQTQEMSLTKQISALQQQIESLESERAEKAQALSIPADTPKEKLAEVATQLAEVELDRLRRMLAIDLESSSLHSQLTHLEEEHRQQQQQELEDRVAESRRELEAKAQELDRLTQQVIQTVEEARAIANRGTSDWKATTSSLSHYLQQTPDYRTSLPKIVK